VVYFGGLDHIFINFGGMREAARGFDEGSPDPQNVFPVVWLGF
jgi:hypothetical protein